MMPVIIRFACTLVIRKSQVYGKREVFHFTAGNCVSLSHSCAELQMWACQDCCVKWCLHTHTHTHHPLHHITHHTPHTPHTSHTSHLTHHTTHTLADRQRTRLHSSHH